MAQFKDRFRFSLDRENETIKFSITINEYVVIEHTLDIESILLFIQNWNDMFVLDSFEHNDFKVYKKSDGYFQISIKDSNTKHVYRINSTDFSKCYLGLRRITLSYMIEKGGV